MPKIFVYEGSGKYLNSVVVVVAEDIDAATEMIAEKLQESNLELDGITTEFEIDEAEIVFSWNGDY